MNRQGFTKAKLGEIADFANGGAWSDSEYSSDGIPVVRVSDLNSWTVDLSECKFLPEDSLTRYQKHLLKTGDLVVSTVGSHPTQPGSVVGRPAIIPADANGALLNQNAVRIRSSVAFVDQGWLGCFGRGKLFREYIIGCARGAANQVRMAIGLLKEMPVEVPPLQSQQRIAEVVSAYDELIENSQQRIRVLESMTRAIYREWFVKSKLPTNLKDQSFQKTSFGNLCTLSKEPFSEQDHARLPLLDLARMPQRSLAPSDTGAASQLTTSRILFEPGDTLFGAIRCYLHKVVAAHFSGVTNTSVLVLRPKQHSFRSLVAIIASDKETIRWADTHSTGTKMPVINWGVFQTMPAPLPSETLAKEFEAITGPMLDQIGFLSTQIQNLRRTRDLLLPRLLSGQVNIAA